MGVTIMERCRVAPPLEGEAAAEQTLPITFFDVPWLDFHPTRQLLFYQFPCSKTHFLDTIVPNFKQSLSQTLTHFFPLAGSLINALNSEKMPEIRYVPGDSVPVTVAESDEAHDFNHLIGNHQRVADEFYAFQTDLPAPETEAADSKFEKIALFTTQITLFPDKGICVGVNNHHVVADASSMVRFVKAWSSVAKFGREFLTCSSDLLPVCNRSVVNVPSGWLNDCWNQIKNVRTKSPPLKFPTNNVRSTYILQKHHILKLRDFAQSKKPHLTHLSTYVITTAYVWTCLAKSAEESGEEVDADEVEYFIVGVDARERMDPHPPVPTAYFGNCVSAVLAKSTHAELKGDEGFVTAVELIGDVIINEVNKKGEFMRDAQQWMAKFEALIGKRFLGMSGSPKFDSYEADFGWGKPDKYEVVSVDMGGTMSVTKSRQSEGGMEIGFSLPKKKIDAFAKSFASGLKAF